MSGVSGRARTKQPEDIHGHACVDRNEQLDDVSAFCLGLMM